MSFISALQAEKFIVTAEISPPKGTDISKMLRNQFFLRGITDAINITDNQRAVMKMSPLAASSILQKNGSETIMHLTCRDRNRLALQSELLGAYCLGIRNVVVMSGDHPIRGDHPGAKPVYDLDSVQLLGMIQMLNKGFDLSGSKLDGKTDFCTGAVTNVELNGAGLIKLHKKIEMGAAFFQTQAVFDTELFSRFIESIGISRKKVKIIAGIIPLRSENTARLLSKVPGIRIPEKIIRRCEIAGNSELEGMKIAAEIIRELKPMCDGIHIMQIHDHENTKNILEMGGVL